MDTLFRWTQGYKTHILALILFLLSGLGIDTNAVTPYWGGICMVASLLLMALRSALKTEAANIAQSMAQSLSGQKPGMTQDEIKALMKSTFEQALEQAFSSAKIGNPPTQPVNG